MSELIKPSQDTIQEIIDDLAENIQLKTEEREMMLDQLSFMDVEIDKIDEIIKKIDENVPPLAKEINDEIDKVKAAYDARISAGCRSDLEWVVDGRFENDDDEDGVAYVVVKRTPIVYGYYGLKFYQKPLNRDYGSNLIAGFTGNIGIGSTGLGFVGGEVSEFDNIQIGDEITDGIDAPTVFDLGNLPKVVGIGTTNTPTGISTSVVGNITAGSNILKRVGVGSTSAIPIGSGIAMTGILPDNTIVTDYGTASTTYSLIEDTGPNAGKVVTVTKDVYTFVLNNNALVGMSSARFHVGIMTVAPALFLSTSATESAFRQQFYSIRTAEDPDTDFDYEKNPIDPVNIGIIGSNNLGVGHSVSITNNGKPVGPFSWHQIRAACFNVGGGRIECVDQEPDQGAGAAVYYEGAVPGAVWPVLTDDSDDVYWAEEGRQVVVYGTTPPGYESNPADGVPVPGNCSTYDSNIAAAEAARDAVIARNEPRMVKYALQSDALRKVRDEKELKAWGMLQGAAYNREEISKLTYQMNQLLDGDFSEFVN